MGAYLRGGDFFGNSEIVKSLGCRRKNTTSLPLDNAPPCIMEKGAREKQSFAFALISPKQGRKRRLNRIGKRKMQGKAKKLKKWLLKA